MLPASDVISLPSTNAFVDTFARLKYLRYTVRKTFATMRSIGCVCVAVLAETAQGSEVIVNFDQLLCDPQMKGLIFMDRVTRSTCPAQIRSLFRNTSTHSSIDVCFLNEEGLDMGLRDCRSFRYVSESDTTTSLKALPCVEFRSLKSDDESNTAKVFLHHEWKCGEFYELAQKLQVADLFAKPGNWTFCAPSDDAIATAMKDGVLLDAAFVRRHILPADFDLANSGLEPDTDPILKTNGRVVVIGRCIPKDFEVPLGAPNVVGRDEESVSDHDITFASLLIWKECNYFAKEMIQNIIPKSIAAVQSAIKAYSSEGALENRRITAEELLRVVSQYQMVLKIHEPNNQDSKEKLDVEIAEIKKVVIKYVPLVDAGIRFCHFKEFPQAK